MDLSIDLLGLEEDFETQKGGRNCAMSERDDRAALCRAVEEVLSQRLYSIILAVHAAEASLDEGPSRLATILELIHAQSAASLEELRRLSDLR